MRRTFLTPSECAKILEVDPQTIRRYCQRGDIGHTRGGAKALARYQIDPADFERFAREYLYGLS